MLDVDDEGTTVLKCWSLLILWHSITFSKIGIFSNIAVKTLELTLLVITQLLQDH